MTKYFFEYILIAY